MVRTVTLFTLRLSILAVLYVLVARAQWRAGRRRKRQIRLLRGDNPDLNVELGQGELGLDARTDRRVL